MNARVLMLAGLLATAVIAFSGTVADQTGVELTAPAEASCTEFDLGDIQTGCIEQWPCMINPDWHCIE